jgi:hypothetical protein
MRDLVTSEGLDLSTIRARRQDLTMAIGRVERALEEAQDALHGDDFRRRVTSVSS